MCQACNMLIIHYIKSNEESARDWVNKHCSGIPFVFVESDSHIMGLSENFSSMIARNDGKTTGLNYGIPEMDTDNLRYFDDKFNVICDQIHSIIKLHAIDAIVDDEKWRFMKFLSTKGTKNNLSSFITVLKNVEENFAEMVDSDSIFETSSECQDKPLTPALLSIMESIETHNTDRSMSKLRESIRIIRTSRLSVFSELSEFEKIMESHNDETIK
jgi:hypothetical protein